MSESARRAESLDAPPHGLTAAPAGPLLFAAHRPWVRVAFDRARPPGQWLTPASPEALRAVWDAVSPARAFFADWSWRVPDDLVDTGRCVGFHAAALPAFRGGSPLQHQILDGRTETLLTAFVMTREFDAGPILCQRPLSLGGSLADIWRAIAGLIPGMVREIIETDPTPTPQAAPATAPCRRRRPEDSRLGARTFGELELPALYDQIRCVDAPGYPPVELRVGARRLIFTEARLDPTGSRLVARVEIM